MSEPVPGSEFPPREQMNWDLLQQLYEKPHPLVNNSWQPPDVPDPGPMIELFDEVKAAHHLLDLAGVPHGYSMDTRSIDCRTLIAIMAMGNLRERLDRISSWHSREAGPAGTVGDYCSECGLTWPCETRRMADGTYTDEEEP